MLACRVWLSSSDCFSEGVIAACSSLRGNGEGIFTCCQSTALYLLFLLKPFSLGGVASAAFSVFRARRPPGPEVWHFLQNFKDLWSFQLWVEAVLLSLYLTAWFQRPDINRKVCVLNALMFVFQKDNMIFNQCMSAYKSLYISMCLFACMQKCFNVYLCVLRRL